TFPVSNSKRHLLRIASLLATICAILPNLLVAQTAHWEPRGPGGGGAYFGPSINPASNNEIYVTSDMSGLYRSIDYGLNYSLIPFSTSISPGCSSTPRTSTSRPTTACLSLPMVALRSPIEATPDYQRAWHCSRFAARNRAARLGFSVSPAISPISGAASHLM